MKVTTIRGDVTRQPVLVVSLKQVNNRTWFKVPDPIVQNQLPVVYVVGQDVPAGRIFRISGYLERIEEVS